METTPIFLTKEEALLFVAFQKRYAFFRLLETLKVFELKSGSVEIHFDNLGGIGSVDIHQHFKGHYPQTGSSPTVVV